MMLLPDWIPFFRKTGSSVSLLLVLACIVISAGCIGYLLPVDRVTTPHITPVMDATAPLRPQYVFPFQDMTVKLTITVNASVYAGAKAADKEVTIYGNVSEQDWISAGYTAMMDDPAQEEFCRDLLGELREIRSASSLSDDEYLELITVFVQSIQYETAGENPPKFPVETFADRSGDCDDKSLLLAGLLSREGYDSALLSFSGESHMAVGIACPQGDYKNTGYAYIETTNITFAGVPPDKLAGGVIIRSDPFVIPSGSGTKVYGACNQTQYLHDMLVSTEERFSALSDEAAIKRAELDASAASGNIKAYNQRVDYYNRLIAQLKQNAEVHNYILNHQYDRAGTYEWVKARISGP